MDTTIRGKQILVSVLLLCLQILLWGPQIGHAQVGRGLVQLAQNCPNPSASMLWEVTGAELEQRGVEVFLFGSVHVGKAEFYPLQPNVEHIFRSSDSLVFEVDPRSALDPAVALAMQARGMLPPGRRLPDVVSASVLDDFETVMADMGLQPLLFMQMKPWMISLLLSNIKIGALGYDAQNGLESYFLQEKSAESQILELESMESQIAMLDSLDPEIFLGYTLKEFMADTGQTEELLRAWECSDKQSLERLLFSEFEEMAEQSAQDREEMAALQGLHDALFTTRNKVMTEGIETFIKTGNGRYFVVVGSAHLLGEGSVIALLEQQGFTVLPVTP